MAKSGIHINPKNKGKFNATKKKTGKSTEELTHSKNPVTKKRAVFAQNAAKWKKGQSGLTLDGDVALHPELQMLEDTEHGVVKDNKKDIGKLPNYGNIALGALLAIDAFLPKERPPYPVVRPAMAYNEHPGGVYGSQAIAEEGITLSNTGYKRNSKDKNKKQLRIPSNKITMKDVDIPLQLIASNGQMVQLNPGDPDMTFPGAAYVDEYPLAQNGTKPIYTNNPKDPRLQAYNDSLVLSNLAFRQKADVERNNKISNAKDITTDVAFERLKKLNGEYPKPTGIKKGNFYIGTTEQGDQYTDHAEEYKKPVQPIIYQKPQQQNKPTYGKQQAYQDSMSLYQVNLDNDNLKKTGLPGSSDYFDPNRRGPETRAANRLKSYNGVFPSPINVEKYKGDDLYYYKKPVAPPTPQRPKGKLLDPSLPNYDMSTGARPVPRNMDMPRADYDFTKKTKFAFAYPDEQGKQQNMYFPTKKMLQEFIKGTRGASSQEGENYMTATGYMQNGGSLQTYYEEGKDYDVDEKEISKLISQGYKIQYL